MTESPGRATRPALLVFDVNETLSDISALATRFEDVARHTWHKPGSRGCSVTNSP